VTTQTFRPGQVYLGWRHAAPHPDPGPPPRRPVPPEPEQLNQGWLSAQRWEERFLARPYWLAAAGCLGLAAVVILLGTAGPLNAALTAVGVGTFTVLAWRAGAVIWRGRRDLRSRIAAETSRVTTARAAQESQLFAAQEEHAQRFRQWQAGERSFTGQPRWYAVALPEQIDRIDVVGGTLAGWSALVTMVALPRLTAGGQVTVIDLSEGAVAGDLVKLARDAGVGPLVWLLPGDLPRFDLGAGLPAAELTDVLAASVSADGAAGGGRDPAGDHAIVERVLQVLGDGAEIAQVTAALRALGQVGDPRADLERGLLTPAQLESITGMYGRGAADRVVIERAWALEARLRVLDRLGCDPVPLPRSRLRVVATDRSAGAFGNATLGAYVTVSLTHLLRRARAGRPWQHTLCLAGAEKLHGDALDRLASACESARTGLVLAYRSIPAHVRERLGRGNAALAVMRLGNAEDAKVASEQIGIQHRFVISQFTETVGASVSDTAGASYTGTVGTAYSVAASVSASQTTGLSRGRGRSTADLAPLAPQARSRSREASESAGTSETLSLTDGINASTSWGLSTSRAVGTSDSLARTTQRSREFLVEPHELQQLPPSAVIVSYASPEGRRVVLADANPAILTLPSTTVLSLEEIGQAEGRGWPGQPPSGEPAATAPTWAAQAQEAPAAGRWGIGPAGRRRGAGGWPGGLSGGRGPPGGLARGSGRPGRLA